MKNIGRTFILALIGWWMCGSVVSAQEQMGTRERAYAMYLSGEYANAIDYYAQIYQKTTLKPDEVLAVARSYRGINEYAQANGWYANYLTNVDDNQVRLEYARVLKAQAKYREARAEYNLLKQTDIYTPSVERELKGIDSAEYWMKHPTTHILKNEEEVNTDLSEFGVWPMEDAVIYTGEPSILSKNKSGKTGKAYLKVYAASIDQDQITLKYPNIMDELFNDAKYHVGPVVSNKDKSVLYVTRTNPASAYESVKTEGLKFRKKNLELIVYTKQGDYWEAEPFAYNNLKEFSLGHAALSEDEKTLYYASDMPGGMGGVDIWKSTRMDDGSWGVPVNLGPEVNTEGDEMFPSIYQDTLYFSSDGHLGMGGLDIYRTVIEKGRYSKVQNMKYPINSSADDFAFVLREDNEEFQFGYLSSDREGGKGGDDIYSFAFKKPKYIATLIAKAYDKETNQLLDNVDLQIIADNADKTQENHLMAKGEWEQELMKNRSYVLSANKAGYMGDVANITVGAVTKDTTLIVNFKLQPIHTKGISFVLEDIFYDFDKSDIRPDAALVLDKLVKVMEDNPTLRIELSSHTDSRGSDAYNLKLSDRRAKSAVDYLISKGIAKDRMVAKGYGETRLVNGCANGVECTEEQHQMNRRTEIEVLDY